jgi:hypothetical protein
MAIAALVIGIVSINCAICFWTWPIALGGLITGIVAVVFGGIASGDPFHPNMATAGRRLGIAGIIVGTINTVIGIILTALGVMTALGLGELLDSADTFLPWVL